MTELTEKPFQTDSREMSIYVTSIHNRMFLIKSRGWLDGYSLYHSSDVSVYLDISNIKYWWEKETAPASLA